MSNAMHVAKTGLNAQNTRMQVIANNLANVNTTGFKKDRANFESLLYQVIKESGAQTSGECESEYQYNYQTINYEIGKFPLIVCENIEFNLLKLYL